MARGVGSLTVSVNANTAKAQQNLKLFRGEMKSVAMDARRMAAEFQGNKLADYAKKFGAFRKPSIGDFKDSSVVDLRNDLSRYAGIAGSSAKATSALRMLSGAMKVVGIASKFMGLAGIVVTVGQLGYALYKNKNAWTDWGTWVGRKLRIIDQEGQRADEILGSRLDKQIDAMNKRRAEKDRRDKEAAARRKADNDREFSQRMAQEKRAISVSQKGEIWAQWEEDTKKLGSQRAGALARAAQEREGWQQAQERKKAAADAREEARKKRELDNERRHAEAMRKAREQREYDRDQVLGLADRMRNFGKSDLEQEADSTLRGISDPKMRRQARGMFNRLEQMESMKNVVDKNRETIATREAGKTSPLDARSAEGWAALRDNVRNDPANEMVKKQEQQLKLTQETNRILADRLRGSAELFDPGRS